MELATVILLVLLVACLASLVAGGMLLGVRIYLDYARAWDEWERQEEERFKGWREKHGS